MALSATSSMSSSSASLEKFTELLLQSQQKAQYCAELAGAMGNSVSRGTTGDLLQQNFAELQRNSGELSTRLRILPLDESARMKLVAKVQALQGDIVRLFQSIPPRLQSHRIHHERSPKVEQSRIKRSLPAPIAAPLSILNRKLETLEKMYNAALEPWLYSRAELSKTKAESLALYERTVSPLQAQFKKMTAELSTLRKQQELEVEILEREKANSHSGGANP